MIKRVLALILSAALCLGGMVWIFRDVSREQEAVTITQEPLLGDPAMAEGLLVQTHSEYNHQIFWHTDHIIGAHPQTSTQFDFRLERSYYEGEPEYWGISLRSNVTTDLFEEENPTGIGKARIELLEQCAIGQSKSATLYVADYYDYYPLDITIDLPNNGDNLFTYQYRLARATETDPLPERYAVFPMIQDYFKIPVLPDHTVDIEVTRHTQTSSGSSASEQGYYLSSISAVTNDAVYLTFDCHYGSELIDLSHLPEGFGIFRLPYSLNESGMGIPDGQGLSMVYPLDPTAELLELRTSAQKDKLMLHTREEGWYAVTIIDCATFQTLQKIRICPWDMEITDLWLYEYEDFFVAVLGYEQMIIMAQEENGDYALQFSIPIQQYMDQDTRNHILWHGYTPGFAYDGEKLAIVNNLHEDRWNNSHTTCSFTVMVFDAEGLKYHGNYYSSLSEPQQSLDEVNPVYGQDISVRWT